MERLKMSERGTKFLDAWLIANISGSSYPDEEDSRVIALAKKCIVDAQAAGIPIGEIEEDAGPIEDSILETMEEVAIEVPSRVASGGRLG
jgi:hypothetical protein